MLFAVVCVVCVLVVSVVLALMLKLMLMSSWLIMTMMRITDITIPAIGYFTDMNRSELEGAGTDSKKTRL